MADLIFSEHAREQLRERRVPEVAVYHVVEYADTVLERYDGCTEYTGTWEGRFMIVVLCGEDEPYRVATVIVDKRKSRRRR
jgi:hypothetical protein